MNQQKRRSSLYWDKILSEQATSGMTAIGFCRERSIAPSSFFSAKKRQRLAQSKGVTAEFAEHRGSWAAQKTEDSAAAEPTAFVAVQVAESSGDDRRAASAIRVQLHSGHQLWVDSAFDAAHLGRLIAVLEAAS